MIIRLGLNFAAHLAAGVAVGVIAAYAAKAARTKQAEQMDSQPVSSEAPTREERNAAEAESASA